jgi:glycosyltransferase involved in cell wall biosynthesis
VQAQTYRDFEHIIVDVASVSPVRSRTYRLAVDPGIASSRNHGVAASSGEFIMQLDADDRLHPEAMEKMVALAGAGIIVCPGLKEFGGSRGITGAPDEAVLTLPTFLDHNPIYCCSMYSRKDFKAVGGYDPFLDFVGCEDYEFWTALVKMGCCVKVVPEFLFYYRVHFGSLTERSANDTACKYIRKKHGPSTF